MQRNVVKPAEYARIAKLNPSTVSRQIASGRIPTVTGENGERLIDVAAANEARRRNHAIISGHGGKRDRMVRREITFKARQSDGFDPSARAILCVMRSTWPDLMRRAVLVMGGDEMGAARAVLALEELVEVMAVSVHDDNNRQRVVDFRKALTPVPEQPWGPEAREWLDRYGDSAWCSDEVDLALPGGPELVLEIDAAGSAASPE